ncbi:MAG: hypothetical protein IAC58_01360 [Firmicutes bacterium]|uniref:Uncharacterized protein n=1 Tax=Candidatus Onthovivens merdipullorum TaxID=2840889 RepID=A0A9D9GTZ6_9BACL|nr:hypothetical protein [Candidatus Onthovivens merdipullorum]
MRKIALNDKELNELKVGADPITLTAVLTVLCTAIVVVLVYKLFTSSEGKTKIPGGWSFEWK